MSASNTNPLEDPFRPSRSRYREERTLVRAMFPLPGQTSESFKENVRRLRASVAQFNADVADLCQWLIKLRPNADSPILEAKAFWEFFLEPEGFGVGGNPVSADLRRLDAFEAAVLTDPEGGVTNSRLPQSLDDSIRAVRWLTLTNSARNLFGRMQSYSRTHRLLLLNAAADWTLTRYVRGYMNWVRNKEEWQIEKTEWEKRHPDLTEDVGERFNHIFRQLGVMEKRPRVCTWELLKLNKDNCEYAGEGHPSRHSLLCGRYRLFLSKPRPGSPPNWKKFFRTDAEKYLRGGINALPPPARTRFLAAWRDYLQDLDLSEETIRSKNANQLPHCEKLGDNCDFNPHTEKCTGYKDLLAQLSPEFLSNEPVYRAWRRLYLSGPKKPAFPYPSARYLSMSKILGKEYYKADFEKSEVGLRLDDMRGGDFLTFRFRPWPRDYSPQPGQTEITSVNVHFVGSRARVGFRFRVAQKPSRFDCTQDALDELRSRKFPRQSQDQLFLDAAREQLLSTFHASPEKDLKLLAVDLGEQANAAVFEGRQFREAHKLKIVKIEKLYATPPPGRRDKPATGLSKEHVGRHLETVAEESREIADARASEGPSTLRPHDLRGLVRHVGSMIRDWARLNASQIIQLAQDRGVDLIVFESMRGFKPPGYDKLDLEKKRRMAFFAFGSVRKKVTEKAVERGMRVITVPYLYSSQVCCQCGRKQEDRRRWLKNKRGGRFQCQHTGCGFRGNADENAARVLARVFWREIALPVTED